MTEPNLIGGLIGGGLIGLASLLLLAVNGRIAGISGILGGLVTGGMPGDRLWRSAFLAGLVAGGRGVRAGPGRPAAALSSARFMADCRRLAGGIRHPDRLRLHLRPRSLRAGTALAALASLSPSVVLFVAAMITGQWLASRVESIWRW